MIETSNQSKVCIPLLSKFGNSIGVVTLKLNSEDLDNNTLNSIR